MQYNIQDLLNEARIIEQNEKNDIKLAVKEMCENYSDIYNNPEYKQFVLERQQLFYILKNMNPKIIQEATFAPSITSAKDLEDVMNKIEHCNAPSKMSFSIFKICVDTLAYGSSIAGGAMAFLGDYGGFSPIERLKTFGLGFLVQHVIKYGAPFIVTLYHWFRRLFGKDDRLSYGEKINMMKQASKAIDDAILKLTTGKLVADPDNSRAAYAMNLQTLKALKIEIEKDIREYEDWKSSALRGVLKYGY